MKTSALLFSLVVGFHLFAAAQCTPQIDTVLYPNGGIVPDPIVGLPDAYQGIPYSTQIDVFMPSTIMINISPVDIDSICVLNITGLPAEFSLSCNTSNCCWDSGDLGCVLVSSNNPQTLGEHSLLVDARIYAKIAGISVEIDTIISGYSITVCQDSTDCLTSAERVHELAQFSTTPNPFSQSFEILTHSQSPKPWKLYNHDGSLVMKGYALEGETVRADHLPPGLYFLELKLRKQTEWIRVIKQ